MSTFYAHSGNRSDRADWQVLIDHLNAVAEAAAHSAAKFGAADLGRAAGLLHDLGKYNPKFQARLDGGELKVDHSTAGARVAIERYSRLGRLIAYVVAGHHAGLANWAGETERRTALDERLKLPLDPLAAIWEEVALPRKLAPPERVPRADRVGTGVSLLVRMLFSCLVDADYRDTEAHYARVEGREPLSNDWARLADLRTALNRHLEQIVAVARDTPVNQLRSEILQAARAKSADKPGLFTLTVPTGGGKTLSSLAFALDHALAHGLDRIIYVIPFTSIIEQTAVVFRGALAPWDGSVLEHHSAFDQEALSQRIQEPAGGEKGAQARDKLRLAMDSWDAPVVVTTAVQFFESLFSAKPSKCRKLHNIARSVVVLDEAQTLPLPLLKPCVAALDELAHSFGSSIVLCTATQPALIESGDKEGSFEGGFRADDLAGREIAPDPPTLYRKLERVRVRHIEGQIGDEELSERLRAHQHVLCIVQTRAHARELYRRLESDPGTHHLSALMYPAHRSRRLDEIKVSLKDGRPCRLIATTLIEAGVDVDFPVVYRAMAGIESLAQAAGRCNREGRRSLDESFLYVFEAQDRKSVPELAAFADAARAIMRQHSVADLLSLGAIEDYFGELYWKKQQGREDGLDKKGIIAVLNEGVRRLELPFETIESLFRMIETDARPVIIDHRDDRAAKLVAELDAWDRSSSRRVGDIARDLQRYLVQVPRRALAELVGVGSVQPIKPRIFEDQFLRLVNQDLYDNAVGLDWSDPAFRKIETTIL